MDADALSINNRPEPVPLTMYSTPWCGYCKRLKVQMEREGIDFVEVNIDNDPEAAEFVVQVNRGNATVPTLHFEDGSVLANPTMAQIRAQLAASGPLRPATRGL